MDKNYKLLTKVYGAADAEMIKMFLEAAGLEVLVAQESLGKSLYPVTVGKLAEAKVFVLAEDEERAMALLRDLDDGKFIIEDEEPNEPTEG